MLVVLAVVIALAGIAIPAFDHLRQRARIVQSAGLVQAVVTAMTSFGRRSWSAVGSSDPILGRRYHIWDVNRDGLIDGDPALDPATFPADLAPGYAGFARMAGTQLPPRFIDAQQRVIDAWGQVLRIRFGEENGIGGIGVWSLGPDGSDDGGVGGDDISSWSSWGD